MHSVNSKNQSIFVLLSSRSMSIIRRGRKRGVTQMALKPKEHFHGSDLEKIEAVYGIKKEDIINIIVSKKDVYSTGVHFGPLSIQPMDRCLNHNEKYEKKRFCVQVKWYNLADDIIECMNNKVKDTIKD